MRELSPFLPPGVLEAQATAALQRVNDSATHPSQLVLQPEEIAWLAKRRGEVLSATGRVEFGEGILPRLVATFRTSPYIAPPEFASTVNALMECFYHFRGESLEEISDDELLDFMQQQFDGPCHGSVEYVSGTLLENLARRSRFGSLWEEDVPQDAGGALDEEYDGSSDEQ